MKSAVLLLGCGLLFGGLASEIALRLYAAVDEDARRGFASVDPSAALVEPVSSDGAMGFRPKRLGEFPYYNGATATTNSLGFRGPEVTRDKPAGVFRVLLLGGSTTYGWGVNDDETIDWYMRQSLRRRFPSDSIEVVNMAFDGYDSFQLVQRFEADGLAFDPDVVIVNSGINDVRNVRFHDLTPGDPRTILYYDVLSRAAAQAAEGRVSLRMRAKRLSYVLRLISYARNAFATARNPPASVVTTPNLAAIDLFADNLRRLAELSGRSERALIFSNPPSALASNFDPDHTEPIGYWINDARTTDLLRRQFVERTVAVVERLGQHGYDVHYVRHDMDGAGLFIDDCHLTPDGNRAVGENFASVVSSILRSRKDTLASSVGVR